MSNLPSLKELKQLQQVSKNAELLRKNKDAAKEQLLRIQLMLAKKAK